MKMELQGHVALRLAWKCSPPFSQRVTDRIPTQMPFQAVFMRGGAQALPAWTISVVNQWASAVESRSHLDFLFRHNISTTFGRLLSDKIPSTISMA